MGVVSSSTLVVIEAEPVVDRCLQYAVGGGASMTVSG